MLFFHPLSTSILLNTILSILLLPRITAASASLSNPSQPSVTSIPPTVIPGSPVHRNLNISGIVFENLVVCFNGDILATTTFPSALLLYIDPLSIRPPILLQNFTEPYGLTATLGIAELGGDDMFYVVGSANNGLGVEEDGKNKISSVDMRSFCARPDGVVLTPPVVRAVGSIPSAAELNGMTYLRKSDGFVLVADTILGGVWRFDVESGESKLVIQDVSMAGLPDETSVARFGINGVRVQNDTLFYTNSGKHTMYKIPLHPSGSSAGNVTLVTSGLPCDDFALDSWGFAYVASPSNAIIRVDTRTGEQLVIASTLNNTASKIIGASSAQFGRGTSDRASIYVTTNGGSFTNALPGSQGISRVDIFDLAEMSRSCKKQ